MRRYLVVALLLCSLSAQAADTLRIGSKVLTVGDSAVRAIDLLGKPDFKEPLEDEYGAYRGERWQYQADKGHITTVTIVQGKVSEIVDSSR
ncbi:DUF2845 domain-containing protein [Dyella tabacisoli]|uniref:DUF2845 domain-containing protein n=1 Tax=Dyella tabacisoli TaxID=2282381 RepID=A0A369UIJ4_9GAMM|nr:DUF2845 domain-containing protein [Dyella tabacisoli]RDD80327.1 DUF2845 domain-containing protein [Dyella tabacisoli]